jgi:hypothetical protein
MLSSRVSNGAFAQMLNSRASNGEFDKRAGN